MAEYFIGLDLGQRRDFTALAVVERAGARGGRGLMVQMLERAALGTPYGDVVARTRAVARRPELQGRCSVVADGTGLGGPVVEMLRAADPGCPVIGVTITGGASAARGAGGWRVPRSELLLGLRAAFASGALRIASGLSETERLADELANLRLRAGARGRTAVGAASGGVHDDLAMALALAVWAARRERNGAG